LKIRIKSILLLIGIICVMVVPLTACSAVRELFKNPNYLYEGDAVLVGGDDKPIELRNNPAALDVSFAELAVFIKQDLTDQLQYIDLDQSPQKTPFVCSDFAKIVHNNAEVSGIKAGYVSVDWIEGGIGHALNVFETTDKGTVYIDCTGESKYSQLESGEKLPVDSSWDKVAYIEVGHELGVISLDQAKSTSYDFYQEYEEKWQEYKSKTDAYNAHVKQYNQDIAGKVFIRGSQELRAIQAREKELLEEEIALDEFGADLGTSHYKPLGLVLSFTVHW
jgi:hypothetical protein